MLRLGPRPLPGPDVLARMGRAIAHRGPDEGGAWQDEHVALGMVRLAVMDPEHGHQPVRGCPGSEVTAVYNGEVYNHLELRGPLESAGHPLPDRCDTTVLPHLYEEHDTGMLPHLRGMFAFALWDGRRRRLLLARDRLGIKPLYVAQTPDFLVFASEIKGILASGLVPAAIDRDALDDLFSLTWPCPPRTMFAGIHEVPPGHFLLAEAGGEVAAPRRWWQLRFPHRGEHLSGRRADLEARYREALRETVRLHLRADVPTGVYLSGGLDSSAVAMLVGEVAGHPPTTLSIAFDDPQFDERHHAAVIREALGASGHVFKSSADSAATYPRALWHTELPLVVPVATSGLELSAGTRAAGIPVVLTGDGADEVFGGYSGFRADRMRRVLSHPCLSWLKPAAYRQLYKWAKAPRGAAALMLEVESRGYDRIAGEFGGVYPAWYDIWQLLDVEREALLGVGGRPVRPTTEAPSGWQALVPEDVAELDPLDALLAVEQATRLPAWILIISDRCSMAHGVEARVPFLDHELVELAARMPPSAKMRGFREKDLLRGAMKGVVPEAVRRRTKQPFVTPIRAWFFHDDAPDYVRELLSPAALAEAGLFEPEVVGRLHARLAEAPAGHVQTARLEAVMMLVLGTQLLHHLFVAHFDAAGPPDIAAPPRERTAIRR